MGPPREVVVVVTAEDIRIGDRVHCQQDAVARAVNRLPGFSDASVGPDDFGVDVAGGLYAEYLMPPEGTAFVYALRGPGPLPAPITFTATLREAM